MKKIYIIYHGRYPSEKAAAILATEELRSFMPYGQTVGIFPRLIRRSKISPQNFYHLKNGEQFVFLPTLDFYFLKNHLSIAFRISYYVFSFFAFLYLFIKAKNGDVVITNEPLVALASTCTKAKTVLEIHDYPEKNISLYKKILKRCDLIIATNEWKKTELLKTFDIKKIIVERNGVDLVMFTDTNKEAARKKLHLPLDKKILLYTGHLYDWKGVDTLAESAKLMPENIIVFVGGNPVDVDNFKKTYDDTANILIIGHVPHEDIPLWQSASDALVLPNSGKMTISTHYTSPMKLFEYMASRRPIVASNLPSIEEVVGTHAHLFTPDDPKDLASAVNKALNTDNTSNINSLYNRVQSQTWHKRAERIMQAI